METIDCIYGRRSVRRYRNIHVDMDLIGKVVEAGRMAPSSGNIQNWRFVLVQDKEKREALASASNDQHWMTNAPVHIVVISDPDKAVKYYGARGERLYSSQNCAACIQNMLLAAHNYGLGSCWVGSFDEYRIRELIGVPDKYKVEAIVTLGFSAEEPSEPHRYKLFDQLFVENFEARAKDGTWNTRDYAWSITKKLQAKAKETKEDSPKLLEKSKDFLGTVKKKLAKK